MSSSNNNNNATPPGFCCYWYNQGKCFLFELPDVTWVYDFLSQSEKAREDLLKCAGQGHCEFFPECPPDDPDMKDDQGLITQKFIDYAKNPDPLCNTQDSTDEFMSFINQYVDNHRNQPGEVFKKGVKGGDGNDD